MGKRRLRIGFDFDNTIVCYDKAIAVLADKIHSLPAEVPRTRDALKKYLRTSGQEKDWTAFQGTLYGPGMTLAKPFDGAIETMQELTSKGHQLIIVSHRSRKPYAGPPYDLHGAARKWVSKHLIHAGLFLADGRDSTGSIAVNFMETRDAKIKRIIELRCHVFLDDLLEVIEDPGFPESTTGILFNPGRSSEESRHLHISTWMQLPGVLHLVP
jgi:hypothetical protein